MSSESRSSQQIKLNECLDNSEAKNQLLQFFEVLIKIDDRERIVKSPNSTNKDSEEINDD